MNTLTKASIKWMPNSYHHFKSYIQYFKPDNPIFAKISQQQSIVTLQRISKARQTIAQCEMGRRQLLHIGDCAQSFQDSNPQIVKKKAQFFKQCSQILSLCKKKPVNVFGRIAGQFAKPRSQQYVVKDDKKMHNYKGDNVNTLDETQRDPSTSKLFQGYQKSKKIARILEQECPELFFSHEGLILPYQESLTRFQNDSYYCSSADMLWIGQRTRQLDGAHVQYFRGITNPVGVKVSSKIQADQFYNLVTKLNPNNQNGKLLVIIRMGKNQIESKLQELIKIKQKQKLNFLFVTDPMHANTYQIQNQDALKTRNISHILQQIRYFESKLKEKNIPHGYSLEATYQNVTECHGLAHPLQQNQITSKLFTSKCDPRLNNQQTKHLLSILSQ